MWKNKQIKQRARKSLKANYFTIIMITFLLAFFGIISSESSQFIGMPSTEEIALGQTQHTNKKIEGVNTRAGQLSWKLLLHYRFPPGNRLCSYG